MDGITRLQNDDSIRNLLKSSAEMFYRLRPCSSCGRQRMHVCFDGRLRCEKCSLDIEAGEGDLADVFGTGEGYIARLKGTECQT